MDTILQRRLNVVVVCPSNHVDDVEVEELPAFVNIDTATVGKAIGKVTATAAPAVPEDTALPHCIIKPFGNF